MARPTKQGLDYFPLDVDFYEDEIIEAISTEFGSAGEVAVTRLLCAIYKKGYYVHWGQLFKLKILGRVKGATAQMIDDLIQRLVSYDFFDKDIFDTHNVLTSPDIQKRYLEATRKRKELEFDLYVCPGIVAGNNQVATEVNDGINAQSKVEEKAVKETKEKESKTNKSEVNGSKESIAALTENFLSNNTLTTKTPDRKYVEEVFLKHDGTREMAAKFFENNTATGWYLRGSPITKFENLVPSFIKSWRENEKNKKYDENKPFHLRVGARNDYSTPF